MDLCIQIRIQIISTFWYGWFVSQDPFNLLHHLCPIHVCEYVCVCVCVCVCMIYLFRESGHVSYNISRV